MAWTPQSWGQAWTLSARGAECAAQQQHPTATGWPSSSWQGWWQCRCGAWAEPTKKKCQRCGLKKAWATAAASEWTTYIYGDKIKSADGQIMSVEAAEARNAADAAAARTSAMEESWYDMSDHDRPPACQERPQDRIKEIDALLITMIGDGPTTLAMRQQLMEQKEAAKKEVTMSKPLPMQMETCRGAVDRASKRADAAREAREKAQAKLNKATEFEEKMLNDLALKRLEMQRLEQTVIERARSSGPASTAPSTGNSLENLRNTMAVVIAEMEVGQVEQGTTSEARSLMEQLFTGLTGIAARQSARNAQASGLAEPPVSTPLTLEETQRVQQTSVMQMLGATSSGVGFHNAAMMTDPGGTMSPTAQEEASAQWPVQAAQA